MSDRKRLRPFTGDDARQVRLAKSPIRLVLCQVAWPELVDFPDDFSEAARIFGRGIERYPVFEEHSQNNVILTPSGPVRGEEEKFYQWRSADNQWSVVLGRRFLSFYRTSYTSYSDFSARLEKVLIRLQEVLNVSVLERVGLRHVNQVVDPRLFEDLSGYIDEKVLGLSISQFATDLAQIESSQNQIVVTVNEAVMQARSGILPPQQTVDPAIPPHTDKSWVLDIDSNVSHQEPFDIAKTLDAAGDLADINYDFFKFAMKDKFFKTFGGE